MKKAHKLVDESTDESDASSDEVDYDQLDKLDEAAAFITSGIAFANFKQDLHKFLDPSAFRRHAEQTADQSPPGLTHIWNQGASVVPGPQADPSEAKRASQTWDESTVPVGIDPAIDEPQESEYQSSSHLNLLFTVADTIKVRIEQIAGSPLSWWPLTNPEERLEDGYLRVYIMHRMCSAPMSSLYHSNHSM